jgi:multisite-specific tRNA:(cytosine-C5)-methyltransferase
LLQKGIELLKVGGKITYSTCSLNIIENEAVVAATLKSLGGKIRLVESSQALPGFNFQQGLTKWDFYNQKSKQDC